MTLGILFLVFGMLLIWSCATRLTNDIRRPPSSKSSNTYIKCVIGIISGVLLWVFGFMITILSAKAITVIW
jgi:short subunit fatty acids transporter